MKKNHHQLINGGLITPVFKKTLYGAIFIQRW